MENRPNKRLNSAKIHTKCTLTYVIPFHEPERLLRGYNMERYKDNITTVLAKMYVPY